MGVGKIQPLRMGNFSPLLTIVGKEDLSSDFARHCHLYQNKLRKELKENIIYNYGKELYQASDDGLNKWIEAVDEGKMDVEG